MCEGLMIPLLLACKHIKVRPSSAHKFQCSLPFKDLPGFYISEKADKALCTADQVRVTQERLVNVSPLSEQGTFISQ